MTKIKEYIDRMCDELEDAKYYAECYIECKAKGNGIRASKYHDMSEDELRHANIVHDICLDEIDDIERIFTPPEEMKKKWADSHTKYVEKTAWVKMMLTM